MLKALGLIIIFLLLVVIGLQIYLACRKRENYSDCSDYKSKRWCCDSKLICDWNDACTKYSGTSAGPGCTAASKPSTGGGTSASGGSTALLKCSAPSVKMIAPIGMDGDTVDWWIILKYPAELADHSHTNCLCSTCEGTPKTPKPGSPDGACYFYADSRNTELTWNDSKHCLNTCDNAMSNTIAQAVDGAKFGIWNDQPEIGSMCDHPSAHSKGMVCYNDDGGFVLNVTTPHFPVNISNPGDSPAGCQDDNNLKAAQQFFCMSFDMDNLKKWGAAAKHAQLCGVQPWSANDILEMKVPDKDAKELKCLPNVPLQTRGGVDITLTIKSGWENYNPWSIVSAGVGAPLQVASWTTTTSSSAGWGSAPCYPGSKGLKQIVTMGDKTQGVFKATFGTTHAKFAISEDPDSPWVCFGSMNQQNTQAARGGDFYSMQNKALWSVINEWISNGTTRVPPKCG